LGNTEKAHEIFNRLIHFGKEHLNDKIKIDYFAVSLPDLLVFEQDLDIKNTIHCNYVMGLGFLGLDKTDLVKSHLEKVLDKNINHQGAIIHLKMIKFLEKNKGFRKALET
jgi:hypothetical protein